MLGVKNGDTQKLGLLYERYKKWLFNFFYQLCGERDLSEDMVQNVFMRILKYKHTYSEDSKYVTWMFQIARNVNNDHFRKNKKHQQLTTMDSVAYKVEGNDDFEGRFELNENKGILMKALASLPDEKREILVLSKLKGLKYQDIGTIMNCTESTARQKTHRALKELKHAFFTIEKN